MVGSWNTRNRIIPYFIEGDEQQKQDGDGACVGLPRIHCDYFLTNTCNFEFVAFQTVPTSHWRMRHRSSIMVSFVSLLVLLALVVCLCTRECAVGIRKLLPILALKTRFHIEYDIVLLLTCI